MAEKWWQKAPQKKLWRIKTHNRSIPKWEDQNSCAGTPAKPSGWLKVTGARENNLKNIDVKFPLGVMTCVTGVSGSGKSSLVNEILYKRLARDLNRARTIPGKHKDIKGIEKLDKVINIDQSPIGRTPRSNPATYTGVFDLIRELFAATPDAKARGYQKDVSVLM